MPVNMDQVRQVLSVDEPNYGAAMRLGENALPHLEILARTGPPGLAAKAVHLASLISAEGSVSTIEAASNRSEALIRVAAAAALSRVPTEQLADVAVRLLADSEEGVRRRVIASLPVGGSAALNRRLADLSDSLPDGAHRADVLSAVRKTIAGNIRGPRKLPL